MTNEKQSTLVLRDDDGTHYLLTPELLARARVPAERAYEIERLLELDDAAGFQLGTATTPALTNANIGSISFVGTLIKVAPESGATDVAEDVRPAR